MESEAVARGDVTPLSSTTLGPYVYYISLFIFIYGLFNPSHGVTHFSRKT
jgi:hypothetical protein